MSDRNTIKTPVPPDPTPADGTESPPLGEDAERPAALEVAHVLFMDIVGYSKLLFDEQTDQLNQLQKVVSETQEFGRRQSAGELICLPTGDGMALVFFGDPESPLRCAAEVSRALRAHAGINLRMGIHSGPVYRIADINANQNVAGGGINIAQRVMDCGDAGHILLSKRVADDLGQLRRWAGCIHDLGAVAVKHGVLLHVFNFHCEGVGNSRPPNRFAAAGGGAAHGKKRLAVIAASVILLLTLGGVLVGLAVRQKQTQPPAADAGEKVTSESAPVRTLGYWITVQKYRGGKPFEEPFRLAGEINFELDYQIRLTVSSPQLGYLYILNEGPTKKEDLPQYNVLFPSPTANNGSALIAPNQEVSIPEKSWLRFDEERGTETVWFVWAGKSIPELEAVRTVVNEKDRGAISNPSQLRSVRDFFASYQDGGAEVERDAAREQTTLKAKDEVLVYPLKLEHN